MAWSKTTRTIGKLAIEAIKQEKTFFECPVLGLKVELPRTRLTVNYDQFRPVDYGGYRFYVKRIWRAQPDREFFYNFGLVRINQEKSRTELLPIMHVDAINLSKYYFFDPAGRPCGEWEDKSREKTNKKPKIDSGQPLCLVY